MLVLSRKLGQRIEIGDGIVIEVLGIHPRRVRLGIDAPGIDVTRPDAKKTPLMGRALSLKRHRETSADVAAEPLGPAAPSQPCCSGAGQ